MTPGSLPRPDSLAVVRLHPPHPGVPRRSSTPALGSRDTLLADDPRRISRSGPPKDYGDSSTNSRDPDKAQSCSGRSAPWWPVESCRSATHHHHGDLRRPHPRDSSVTASRPCCRRRFRAGPRPGAVRCACCDGPGRRLHRDRRDAGTIFTTVWRRHARARLSKRSCSRPNGDGADVRHGTRGRKRALGARKHPDRGGVIRARLRGTTMPSTALTVLRADADESTTSRCCLQPHQIITHGQGDPRLTGLPGSTASSARSREHVVRNTPYGFHREHLPAAGSSSPAFEPLDILHSIWMVLKHSAGGRSQVESQYSRHRPRGRQPGALDAIGRVFELAASSSMCAARLDHHSVCAHPQGICEVRPPERSTGCSTPRSPTPKAVPVRRSSRACSSPGAAKVFGTDLHAGDPDGSPDGVVGGPCAAVLRFGTSRRSTSSRSPHGRRSADDRPRRPPGDARPAPRHRAGLLDHAGPRRRGKAMHDRSRTSSLGSFDNAVLATLEDQARFSRRFWPGTATGSPSRRGLLRGSSRWSSGRRHRQRRCADGQTIPRRAAPSRCT